MENQILKNFMKCHTCNTELKMSERSGIEIDYCPQCRGVWLDKGELDKIIERSGFESRSPQNRNRDDADYNQHDNKILTDKEGKNHFLATYLTFDSRCN